MNSTEQPAFQNLERTTAADGLGIKTPFGARLKNHLSTLYEVIRNCSIISVINQQLPPPTFAPNPLKCSQRLSKAAIAFQQLGQLKKNLSTSAAITAWADVRLLFAGDGRVPISTELKTAWSSLFWLSTRARIPCVCSRACGERARLSARGHTQMWGGKEIGFLFSAQIPEIKTTREKKILHFVFSEKQKTQGGRHRQFSWKSCHSVDENKIKSLGYS